MTRLTRAQLREIDRRSIERHHIPGVVLMENAARAVVDQALAMLSNPTDAVLILCGGGNNGGDGLAVARHLHNHGLDVQVVIASDPDQYQGDASINWKVIRSMSVPIGSLEDARTLVAGGTVGLVIDALFGTGLSAPPRDPFGAYVKLIESAGAPVLAVDVPSGLDCDSGEPLGPCVRATITVTLVAEKVGFANPRSKDFTGEIVVGGIGCPRELIEEVRRDVRA